MQLPARVIASHLSAVGLGVLGTLLVAYAVPSAEKSRASQKKTFSNTDMGGSKAGPSFVLAVSDARSFNNCPTNERDEDESATKQSDPLCPDPSVWPENLRPEFEPDGFQGRVFEGFEKAGIPLETLGFEFSCDEFPCLGIVRGRSMNNEEAGAVQDHLADTYGGLDGVELIKKNHFSVGPGGREYIYIVGVLPPEYRGDEDVQRRLRLRIQAQIDGLNDNVRE